MSSSPKFIFFGGEPLGVPVLEQLQAAGLVPSLVVCSPDKPVGRKQVLTPPPVKVWAEAAGLPVWQPMSWRGEAAEQAARAELAPHLAADVTVFVVVAYNHILPQWLLDLAPQGALNLHPSLLPALRGPSPIRTAILEDTPELLGITIMLLDDQMDHGPILDQLPYDYDETTWPVAGPELDQTLARVGGELLADVLPAFVAGDIAPQEQPHEAATYSQKFSKADSQIMIDPFNLPRGKNAWILWCKINAFAGIGDTFFIYKDQRIKITTASWHDGRLEIASITPAGKQTLAFADWLRTQTP